MTTETLADKTIADDVAAELLFDPQVTTSDLSADVTDGRVTLTGIADSYATKWAAECAAYRESGVRSVHNLITVNPHLLGLPNDTDLAASVRQALQQDVAIPAKRLQVLAIDGHVTLSGNVDWHYQRTAAEQIAGGIRGVRLLTSDIHILPPTVSPAAISDEIRHALVRSAQIDAQHLTVKVEGSKVTLSGKVRSWAERTEAVNAVWRTKGVGNVEDNLTIQL